MTHLVISKRCSMWSIFSSFCSFTLKQKSFEINSYSTLIQYILTYHTAFAVSPKNDPIDCNRLRIRSVRGDGMVFAPLILVGDGFL